MDANKITVGLVIAQPVKDTDQPLSELLRYTQDKKAEVILFPEDHIYAELKELVSGRKEGRTPEDGLTVFKSVGIAIQDSSVANLVLRKLRG